MDANDTASDSEQTDDLPPVVVELHAERPDVPTGVGDAVWCKTECDDCGKEGYTVEDALDDARGRFGPARGLNCRECGGVEN